MAKRLELLKDTFPRARQIAVLLRRDNPANGPAVQALGNAANLLKVELQQFEVRGPDELERAFTSMVKNRISAVVVFENAILFANVKEIAELAAKRRLPSAGFKEFAEAGGLLGYGANIREMYHRTAYFVDRILKGAKPDDLPIEQATRFEMVVNMKTAKALGIKIPNSILVRATNVIQ